MNAIRNFDDLTAYLSKLDEPRRVAVVCPNDESTCQAVHQAIEEGFARAILVGCQPQYANLFDDVRKKVTFIPADDVDDAAARAVSLVRDGMADVLMKGLLNTDNLLRAVLNKQTGILPQGRVLTHITCAQMPQYEKLIFCSDVAVIPQPTKEQREAQLVYLLNLCRSMGIREPGVALINCSEKVDERHFPHTVEYRELVKRAEKGEFGQCVVDGPLDLKTALSAKALKKKGLHSPLKGFADALIFPDIQAGNVFYKAITLFCRAQTAAMLQGPQVPVVLTSRADDWQSKYYSLALASL